MPEFSAYDFRPNADKGTLYLPIFTNDPDVNTAWEAVRTETFESDPDFPLISSTAFHQLAFNSGAAQIANVQSVRMHEPTSSDARNYGHWIVDMNIELTGYGLISDSNDWKAELKTDAVSIDGQQVMGPLLNSGSAENPTVLSQAIDFAARNLKDFIGGADIIVLEFIHDTSLFNIFKTIYVTRVRIKGSFVLENSMFL